MIPFLVSAQSLHDRRFRLRDRSLEHASAFPFFDGQGVVHALMLVARDSPRIAVVDWAPALTRQARFRARRIERSWSELADVDAHRATSLATLWHFDPWWVLGDERFAGRDAVPGLKATNLPGVDESVQRVYFDSRLGRVVLLLHAEGDSVRWEPFTRHSLDSAEERRRSRQVEPDAPTGAAGAPSGWRLRPFWEGGAARRSAAVSTDPGAVDEAGSLRA